MVGSGSANDPPCFRAKELVWKPEEQVAKMKGAVLSNMTFLNKISGMIDKASPSESQSLPSSMSSLSL